MSYIAVRPGSDGLKYHGDGDDADDAGSDFPPWWLLERFQWMDERF